LFDVGDDALAMAGININVMRMRIIWYLFTRVHQLILLLI